MGVIVHPEARAILDAGAGELIVDPDPQTELDFAAATPASTGTCRPVVSDRSPPVSAMAAIHEETGLCVAATLPAFAIIASDVRSSDE